MSDGELFAFMGAFAIVGVIAFIIVVAIYLVDAIGRFKYLKARNYQNAWFAFIPFLSNYGVVEATYGKVEKVKIWGVELPIIVVELYPLIIAVLSGITSRINYIGGVCGTVLSVVSILISIAVFKDIMERIERPVTTGFAVLANIIAIVGAIKLLIDASSTTPGQYDYTTDTRVLQSQQ